MAATLWHALVMLGDDHLRTKQKVTWQQSSAKSDEKHCCVSQFHLFVVHLCVLLVFVCFHIFTVTPVRRTEVFACQILARRSTPGGRSRFADATPTNFNSTTGSRFADTTPSNFNGATGSRSRDRLPRSFVRLLARLIQQSPGTTSSSLGDV
eukprot:1501929-Amphidinium_carterae.1